MPPPVRRKERRPTLHNFTGTGMASPTIRRVGASVLHSLMRLSSCSIPCSTSCSTRIRDISGKFWTPSQERGGSRVGLEG